MVDGPRSRPCTSSPWPRMDRTAFGTGIALSSTLHWMFDRGLISIDDHYSLLLKRNATPGSVLSLVNSDRRARVPEERIYRPHRRFLEYHRERVFTGVNARVSDGWGMSDGGH